MELYERVRQISATVARSQSNLARGLELSQATFSGYLNEKRQDNLWPLLPKILELYPQVSRAWLYFDEGEMLTHASTPPKTEREAELQAKIVTLEQEKEALAAELREADRLNRQLTTRLLVDGTGDKGAATGIGKVGEGQE